MFRETAQLAAGSGAENDRRFFPLFVSPSRYSPPDETTCVVCRTYVRSTFQWKKARSL